MKYTVFTDVLKLRHNKSTYYHCQNLPLVQQ